MKPLAKFVIAFAGVYLLLVPAQAQQRPSPVSLSGEVKDVKVFKEADGGQS